MNLPEEILKKVKLLEIKTRKMVNNIFAGEYHTHFKGQGMTFADFREYVPGDDVRTISWALTARAGKPYVKTFEEERELSLILAVDVSGSTDFGTGNFFKGEIMVHLAALLAFSAVKNNDQVGLVLFSDRIEHYVPPKKGRGHVNRLLRDLLYLKPTSSKTRISSAVEHLQGVLKKRATIFIFSDFFDENYDKPLRHLGQKHDVVACVVQDPAEQVLPNIGMVEVQDPETGEIMAIDTSNEVYRKDFIKQVKAQKEHRETLLRRSQVDRVDIDTHQNYADPLISFLKRRK